jgi:hypothetical protein
MMQVAVSILIWEEKKKKKKRRRRKKGKKDQNFLTESETALCLPVSQYYAV